MNRRALIFGAIGSALALAMKSKPDDPYRRLLRLNARDLDRTIFAKAPPNSFVVVRIEGLIGDRVERR